MDDYQDKLTIVIPETQDHDEGNHQNQHGFIKSYYQSFTLLELNLLN